MDPGAIANLPALCYDPVEQVLARAPDDIGQLGASAFETVALEQLRTIEAGLIGFLDPATGTVQPNANVRLSQCQSLTPCEETEVTQAKPFVEMDDVVAV